MYPAPRGADLSLVCAGLDCRLYANFCNFAPGPISGGKIPRAGDLDAKDKRRSAAAATVSGDSLRRFERKRFFRISVLRQLDQQLGAVSETFVERPQV